MTAVSKLIRTYRAGLLYDHLKYLLTFDTYSVYSNAQRKAKR